MVWNNGMVSQGPTHDLFAERLEVAIRRSGLTRTQVADSVGIDRSGLSQFLSANADRFPRTETLALLARSLHTSTDWLLGLTEVDGSQAQTNVVDESLAFETPSGEPVDERLVGWLSEARGQKVRYVPATLPDLLKTDAVIRYEYSGQYDPNLRIENATIKLAWQRTPEADVECVSTVQALEGFARGEDLWRTLSIPKRIEQLERMAELVEELYPAFRWFLVDRRHRYTAPVTIFGRRRAALYIGNQYVVFNDPDHVAALISHFDAHLRLAVLEPRQVVPRIRKLIAQLR
jgi:transcriptional regulator with XRE-family HTH domain